MTLVATLKQRLAAPSHLVDLTWIPEMKGITLDGEILRIGATTPHALVASSKVVADHAASGYAVAGVFVARFGKATRVAVTGAGSSVFRWTPADGWRGRACGHKLAIEKLSTRG